MNRVLEPSLRERLRSEREAREALEPSPNAETAEPLPEDRLPPREPESATIGTRGRGAGSGVFRAPVRVFQIQRFPGDLHRRIAIGAATRGMSVRDFVIEALRWAMERDWAPLRTGELVEGALAGEPSAEGAENED